MDLVFFLVPAAILLALIGVVGFIWSVRSGQFDDLDTPAIRMLFEDETDESA